MKFTRSFGFKIFLIVVAMQLLVVATLGFYFISQISKDATKKASNANYQTANNIEHYIGSYMRSFSKNLEILASVPDIVNYNKIKSEAVLKSLVVSTMFISDEDVEIIDNKGHTIANNSLFLNADTLNNKEYLSVIDPRKPHYTKFFMKKNIPTKRVVVAVQNFGVGYGALVSDFSFRRFFNYIFPLRIGKEGFVFLTDKDGTIIVHKDKELVVSKKNIYSLGLPRKFTFSRLDSLQKVKAPFFNIFNRKYMVNFSYNSDYNIGVFVLQPKTEISALVKKMQFVSVLYIILSLIISMFISIFLSTKIISPLNKLSDVMLQVKDGNLDVSSDVRRTDEIGILAEVFEIMRASIKKYINSLNVKIVNLKKIHESLHIMVSERDQNQLINNYLKVFLDVFSSDAVVFSKLNNNIVDEYFIEYRNEDCAKKEVLIKKINGELIEETVLYGKTKISNRKDLTILSVPIIVNNSIKNILTLFKFEKMFFTDDIVETAEIFANQMSIGLENLRLYSEERKKMILDMELENAKIIQDAIFPKTNFDNEWIRLRYSFKAASQLNGDWFKFFYDQSRESLYYVIADVTGHGVGAALLTGTVNSYFKLIEMEINEQNSKRKINEIVHKLNELIVKTNSTLNMTLIFAKLNKKRMIIDICNAGHNHAILFRKEYDEIVYHTLLNQNTRLGEEDYEKPFSSNSYPVKHGDRILFYTDGIIEWITKKGKQWGKKNLVRTIIDNYEYSIDDIIKEIDFLIENQNIDSKLNDDYTFTFIEIL